jgi:hypothetical protein
MQPSPDDIQGPRIGERAVAASLAICSSPKPPLNFARLLLVSGLVWIQSACAIPVLPLQPGTVQVENSTHGLIFGRIEVFRKGQDQMMTLGKTFGWWLLHEDSGRHYVVWLLTHDGPFIVNLPGGQYQVTRIVYDESAGVWEGTLGATFMVKAGEATYLGTWHIDMEFHGQAGRIYGRVEKEWEQAQKNFFHTYMGAEKPMGIALLLSEPEGFLSSITLRID